MRKQDKEGEDRVSLLRVIWGRLKSSQLNGKHSHVSSIKSSPYLSAFLHAPFLPSFFVSVLSFPTRVLLEENGIVATGALATFSDLGKPNAVANLINERRERDKPGTTSTQIVPGSVSLSSDGLDLMFMLKSEIDVQKPELLMEQEGLNQLFRVTLAKASLRANDGNIMAVFASALEQDFNGPDGVALQGAVDSFKAFDQSNVVAAS